LARKFHDMHKFCKERRRSPRGCFECGDTTHFIADCPKRKKFGSSNKYDYTNRNNYHSGDNKNKNHFGDKKKKKFQKIMSRACTALSDFDFTGLCLMGKSSRNTSNSNSDVCDDLSFESLSLRVDELENALCNQDKLHCRVFRENKNLNFKLENSFFLKLLLFG
jgi:hypothetical protein